MEIRFHKDEKELLQILALQKLNNRHTISQEELVKEGFVTLTHSLEDLLVISGRAGHTVAVDNGKVVGYALTMLSEYHSQIPGLGEMVAKIEEIEPQDDYLIMGQVCVAREYRGTDAFRKLYHHIKDQFIDKYRGIYTEIDDENPRSMRAHEKVGFTTLNQYLNKAGKKWHLVYWDWKP